MDESRFKSGCGSHSFYVSLQDQEKALATLERNSRPSWQTVSKEQATHVHLFVQHNSHWAAVQISISPFLMQDFPGQIFHSCHLRYTLCCQAPGLSIGLISTVVQNIYDLRYRSTQWDFSVKSCHTCDPLASLLDTEATTCVRRAEDALLVYQGFASSPNDGFFTHPADTAVDELTTRDKRRRVNAPYQLVLNSNVGDNDNGEQDLWNQLVPRAVAGDGDGTGYVIGNELDLRRSVDDHEMAECDNNHSKVRQETKEDQKAIDILTKKIRKGIKMKTCLKKRKRANNQLQIDSGPTDSVVSEFDTWFAANEKRGIKDKSLCLETLLWTRANNLVENAQEMAWKYRFIASCLHNLRIGDNYDHDKQYSVSVWRWTRAARIVNSIVDKLWETWGPEASLVYEALAAKNYILSEISSISESRQQVIVAAVVANLSSDLPPDISPDTFVLHPAACISAAMKIEYRKVCYDLRLTWFSQLGSTDVLNTQVQMSLLSHQWGQVIAGLRNDSSHRERAASHTSPFDILTAVAVAQINSPALEAAAIESTVDVSLTDHLQGATGDPVCGGAAEGSAVDGVGQEQLIRKDLLPQTSRPSTFNAENSWDIPELPPLFSAENHFDVFATPEPSNES